MGPERRGLESSRQKDKIVGNPRVLAIAEVKCVVIGFRLSETREGSGKIRKNEKMEGHRKTRVDQEGLRK